MDHAEERKASILTQTILGEVTLPSSSSWKDTGVTVINTKYNSKLTLLSIKFSATRLSARFTRSRLRYWRYVSTYSLFLIRKGIRNENYVSFIIHYLIRNKELHVLFIPYSLFVFKFAECRFAECWIAQCRFAECLFAKCRFTKCGFGESRFAEYRIAECQLAECRLAECRFAECGIAECPFGEFPFA